MRQDGIYAVKYTIGTGEVFERRGMPQRELRQINKICNQSMAQSFLREVERNQLWAEKQIGECTQTKKRCKRDGVTTSAPGDRHRGEPDDSAANRGKKER